MGGIKGFYNVTRDQCKDAGLALILIGVIALQLSRAPWLPPALIVVTLLLMIKPTLFKPFAALWFGLSTLLGTVMSKVVLTVVFVVVVTPIALVRSMLGKDSLQLRKWKKDKGSVYRERGCVVTAHDLENMF